MIKRVTIGDLRLTFTAARITKVIGVNSKLDDGRHILMWDFDDISLGVVRKALGQVQTKFLLSDILICETKQLKNYIAYCFTAKGWRDTVRVIAQTKFVDWQFFRFGVYRGHFTLRVTPKGDRQIKFRERLIGYVPANCSPNDLNSWVRYETLKDK